jgi:hypothetical protein
MGQDTDPTQSVTPTVTATPQAASGSLPKTGDYGWDKNLFFLAALLFGSGYLTCEYYERKTA